MLCQDHQEVCGLDGWIQSTSNDAIAYATSLLRDPIAAEDVVQDCYCRLIARAGIYNLPRDGRKLLFEAVTNACINRTTRARTMLSLDYADDDGGWHDRVADPSAQSAERVVMDRELEEAIGTALQRLPTLWRIALELKSLGHSLQQIAVEAGITPTYAGVLVHRARQAMARHLAPMLEGLN